MDERELADRLDRALDDLARGHEPHEPSTDQFTLAIARRYFAVGRSPMPAEAIGRIDRLLDREMGSKASALPIEPSPFSPNGSSGRGAHPHDIGTRRGRASLELAAAILLIVVIAAGPFGGRQLLDRVSERWVAAPARDVDVSIYGGDSGRTGEMPGPGPKSKPVEQWRVVLPGSGATVAQSAPLVAGKLVIVAQPNGVVSAFDRMTGEQAWSWQPSEPLRLVGAPVVDRGSVFVGAQDGTFVALDLISGTERWRVALGASPGAPAVVDGSIFVGLDSVPAIADGVVYVTGSCACNAVVALDEQTGAERWRFTGADAYLFALDAATGKERWRYDPHGETLADPSVAGGMIYTVSSAGTAIALDLETGAERWRQAIPGSNGTGKFDATPAISRGVVLVSSRGGSLTALAARSGAIEWQYALPGSAIASPTVADGVVYIGDLNGTLTALDLSDGAVLWTTKLSGLIGGPAAVTNGAIYLLTGDGALISLADKRS